jgi:2-phosphoglycerate kinase
LKTIVVNEKESTRVPFLRGILIRSLLDTGLAFEDAYSLAARIRDELSDTDEISSQDLRQKIAGL